MGEEFCARVGFPLTRVIYRDYLRYPMLSTDLHRLTPRVTEAAMRKIYGFVLGERRKSYFCDLIKDPRVRSADLIHAHFVGWSYMVAVPLARILGIPVTVSAHEAELLSGIDPETLRYVQHHADIIAIGSSEYKRHWANMTGTKEKLRLVHYGVDLSEFECQTISQASPAGRIRLISVARLVPHKRIADGIRAVRQLLDHGIDIEYHIVSDGPERATLEALRSELRLNERVHFLGFLPRAELIAELIASDVLLHPSEAEGFGIAVIEGMAAGLPVVVARSEGVKDIVEHGYFGYLYRPGDIDALVECVRQLANEPARRRRFGKEARRAAQTRFSWEKHMTEMFQVWEEVLGGHVAADHLNGRR